MWSCESCGADVDAKRILCPHCGNGAPFADAGQVRLALQRDLVMEAHLKALAIWYRVGAVVGGVVSLWMIVAFGFLSSHELSGSWGTGLGVMAGAMMWAGALLLALSAGSWMLGHYLSRFVNGARIAAGAFAVIGLVLVVVRTLFAIIVVNRLQSMLSAYGEYASRSAPSLGGIILYFIVAGAWSLCVIWALLSRRSGELCKPSYRTLILRTPEMTAPTFKSPFFILPLAATALAFLFGLLLVAPRF